MNQVFLLLAEFGQADIPLEDVASKYLGLSKEKAYLKAKREELPIPTYQLGSQKSGRFVNIKDLADWLEFERSKAAEEWAKRQVG